MSVDGAQLADQFNSLAPEDFLAAYASGRRDFRSINLLRPYIEQLAQGIDYRYTPPTAGLRYGYWRETVSPLWVDRLQRSHGQEFIEYGPVFHWDGDDFQCLLENNWEDIEEWPDVDMTDFRNQALTGIDLRGAYLFRVDLSGANLEGAKLQRAVLIDVNLSNANLKKADLREAIFTNVRCHAAGMRSCRMERARLSGTDFTAADLKGARLRRANLAGTKWSGASIADARFSRNNLMAADFRGLAFGEVHFYDATFYRVIIEPEHESMLLDAMGVRRMASDAVIPQFEAWFPA